MIEPRIRVVKRERANAPLHYVGVGALDRNRVASKVEARRATFAVAGRRGLVRLGRRNQSEYDGEPHTRPPKVVIASMQASPELVISPEPMARERRDDTRAIPPPNAAQLHGGALQSEHLIWASVLHELTEDPARISCGDLPQSSQPARSTEEKTCAAPSAAHPTSQSTAIGSKLCGRPREATSGHTRPQEVPDSLRSSGGAGTKLTSSAAAIQTSQREVGATVARAEPGGHGLLGHPTPPGPVVHWQRSRAIGRTGALFVPAARAAT